MRGTLVKEFLFVIKSLWSSAQSVDPTKFKKEISKVAKRFDGYREHDAHEFLIYLLEGLHEDLNRVPERKKRFIDCSNEVETISATEKASLCWLKYLECDNSKIVDIFVGQLKSILTCDKCGYVEYI
jgi:ubiquitin carboxyl-terminal hydrolase 2/21